MELLYQDHPHPVQQSMFRTTPPSDPTFCKSRHSFPTSAPHLRLVRHYVRPSNVHSAHPTRILMIHGFIIGISLDLLITLGFWMPPTSVPRPPTSDHPTSDLSLSVVPSHSVNLHYTKIYKVPSPSSPTPFRHRIRICVVNIRRLFSFLVG